MQQFESRVMVDKKVFTADLAFTELDKANLQPPTTGAQRQP
jgi:hypothetical protein